MDRRRVPAAGDSLRFATRRRGRCETGSGWPRSATRPSSSGAHPSSRPVPVGRLSLRRIHPRGSRDLPGRAGPLGSSAALGSGWSSCSTGSDHRPTYLSGSGIRQLGPSRSLAHEARRLRRRVARAERYATAVVALPTSAQLHRSAFIDFLAIGMPFEPTFGLGPESTDERGESAVVRVLHSPTDPVAKGSPAIRTAVERCRERGARIEYRELVGQPNHEVLRALRWCDFVVDEVYSDTPMASLPRKPRTSARRQSSAHTPQRCITSGKIRRSLRRFSAIRTRSREAIMSLASDASLRGELGLRAQAFVTQQWSPADVAGRLLRLIDGAAPAEWVVQPSRPDLCPRLGGIGGSDAPNDPLPSNDRGGRHQRIQGSSPDSQLPRLIIEWLGLGRWMVAQPKWERSDKTSPRSRSAAPGASP